MAPSDDATGKRRVIGVREFRSILGDEDLATSVESFLVALIGAVYDRTDRPSTRRHAYSRARRRRRRFGLLALTAGPLAGVAAQVAALYCEIATFCELAAVNEWGLNDRAIAAELLVLWSLAPDRATADRLLDETTEPRLTAVLVSTARNRASRHLPPVPTSKRGAVEALWAARKAVADGREIASGKSIRGIVFAGRHAKRFVKRAEAQFAAANGGAANDRSQ